MAPPHVTRGELVSFPDPTQKTAEQQHLLPHFNERARD